jgi:hypothetical protein
VPSDFPRSPKLLKGALAVYERDEQSAQPKVIVFQYNPDQIRRILANRTPPSEPSNAGAAKQDVMRVGGPPVETITLTVALNAADQLAEPEQNRVVVEHGLHPALATLEMLLYPTTFRAQEIEQQADRGAVQISPANVPLTLLVWGESRVVPVMLTNFSVTEEAFSPNLNPINAKVELSMRVLTYVELQQSSLGWNAYLAYQRQKENLAQQHRSSADNGRNSGFVSQAVAPRGAR